MKLTQIMNEAPAKLTGEKIQNLNNRIKALKDKMAATKSSEYQFEANAVSGGKVHKFITGKNLTLTGKKYGDVHFELVSIDVIEYLKRHIPIANIKVHLQDKDQFKLTTGCKKFLVGNIVPYSPDYIVNETKKADKKTAAKDENKKPLKIDAKYEELMENHKIALIGKRCPKCYRIHKPTNMCEFFGQVQGKTQTQSKPRTKKKSPVKTGAKKPRCKNGTRRNPKTGNCEAI